MKREILRKVVPYVGMYAKGRGKHRFQGTNPYDGHGGVSGMKNAVYAVVHEGGLNRFGYHYCYGMLREYNMYKKYDCYAEPTSPGIIDTKPLAVLLQIQDKPELVNEEAFRHFIEWMLNYSPYRDIFVTKSVNKALKDKVVVVDANSRANTMMGGMISFRHGWENYNSVQRYLKTNLWWELAQKIDPTIAFAIAHALIDIDKEGMVSDNTYESDHTALNKDSGTLYGFIRNRNVDNSQPWSRRLSYDDGQLSEVWDTSVAPINLKAVVSQALKDTRGSKKDVNPFLAKGRGADRYKLIDAVDSISSTINDLKGIIYA